MPFDPQFDDYVSVETCKAYFAADGGEKVKGKTGGFHLLWGDGVKLTGATSGSRRQIRARGQTGWVDAAELDGKALLELYFIDVGQGDGMLIRTPDFRHIMLDGGYPRASQPTGKSAADFVDWKFFEDYGHPTVVLDEVISSHIDFDHYGGLADLLAITADNSDDLDCRAVSVEHFYHSGLSHWEAHGGTGAGLGPTTSAGGKKWFTRLLGNRASAVDATGNAGPQLKGAWGIFVGLMTRTRTAAGGPSPIDRLSQKTAWLPGYPQAPDGVSIKVLGPVEGVASGAPALLRLDSSQSINTNGTSVLLRVDYGRARILLTGDLNQKAHHALLELHSGHEEEFACDVGKCCHHGSEDVSFEFLSHMRAACTIISSGDHEGHDHPRPRIVAASGLTGHRTIRQDRIVTPLVYSTELARSVEVGLPQSAKAGTGGAQQSFGKDRLDEVSVAYKKVAAGALRGSNEQATLDRALLVHKILYGLVNVRTDGKTILTATMNEGDRSFAVKTFDARF